MKKKEREEKEEKMEGDVEEKKLMVTGACWNTNITVCNCYVVVQ